ncbi:hypothetical protein E2542_SST16363 [Spatholobus suberectus]|nr:hypothetical protein E2542_SST16363 [Spatholobus suberectus]
MELRVQAALVVHLHLHGLGRRPQRPVARRPHPPREPEASRPDLRRQTRRRPARLLRHPRLDGDSRRRHLRPLANRSRALHRSPHARRRQGIVPYFETLRFRF